MTDEDSPRRGQNGPGPVTRSTGRAPVGNHSRRGLLTALAAGGSLLLAGCGLRDSDQSTSSGGVTGTPSSGAADLSQTFRAPIGQQPSRTSVYLTLSLASLLPAAFGTTVKDNASIPLRRFIMEPGVWTDGLWVGGNVHYTWLADPITVTPSKVKVDIRDDARWSDGKPVTGKDVALDPVQRHLRRFFPPYYTTDDGNEPDNVFAAFDDVEITEKSVTYRSADGHFDSFWDLTLRTQLASFNHYDRSSRCLPTHVEPYKSFADAAIETAQKAQRGEIDPWGQSKPWEETPGGDDTPTRRSLAREHLGEKKYVEKFSQAENIRATGAWNPVDFSGTEFTFEKNTHHPNADNINFDRVVFEYTASSDRNRAALRTDSLDYASGVIPQSIVESFPSNIRQLRIPGGLATGNGLGINFDHPALGKQAVRVAIMHALDHGAIATNIHQSTAEPVTTPGGDCWDATEYVSREWIESNLTTYSTDRARAASFMRDAGYTRSGGQWIRSDGKPLELTLATPRDTPKWEPTVANQLSEFGIETSVKTMSSSTFSDEVDTGRYPLWAHWGVATNLAPVTLLIWFYAPGEHDKYGIYPDEQYETGDFSSSGDPRPRTEERWRVFTIEAPPIGQPDGPLREYHPSALALMYASNPPEDEFRRRVKIGMWLANWFLPTIPLNKTLEQHFIDDAHWHWPTDTPSWTSFTSIGPRTIEGILARGAIRANANNPEEDTS